MKIKNKNKSVDQARFSKRKNGFTLIEILVVVAIIAILVSIVLVSLISAKVKAQDNSAFTSFKSLAAPAYMCLTSGSVRLTDPYPDHNICSDSLATSGSNWPDFSKYGWNDFSWCSPSASLSSVPPETGTYNNGVSGGDNSSGNFCFMLKNGSKLMWCTMEGCRKNGF